MSETLLAPGLTVREVARRYRVGEDRVRRWIDTGQLRALNRRDSRLGRPSWVIPPEALEDFERGRGPVTIPPPKRRRKKSAQVDYFPD